MNKDDILSIDDWIKISIKFSGVCLNCKKRLNSGDYGYWSRISKSILHELCYNSLFFQSSSSSSAIKESSGVVGVTSVLDKSNSKTISLDGITTSPPPPPPTASGATDNGISNSNNNIKKKGKKIKCFICNKYIDFNNDFIISLLKLGEKYNSNLDILYCYDCLENFDNDVYENYKKKFLSQI